MSKNCDMIKDLLPLYADDICSEESRKAVEEHIKSCPDCKVELEKLGKNVVVSPQKDANVLKRIKKRLRIEKIVVSIISIMAVCGILLYGLVYFINEYESMDMEKYKILENVSVSEHDNAVWLDIKGYAASFDIDVLTLSDTNGKHLGIDDDFDSEKKNGYGITLKQRKIDDFTFNPIGSLKSFEMKIFDLDEKKDMMKVFYYDDINNKEYILWERD
ncbi:zf-HC2 domain-containing protein [Ruminococcus flavefaciens]|uniref:Anti-sigma-W factor RsiW n=1 Tax=Ruminococcus flavefaciens TaxID=1265 RepID=A0A1M7MCJ3_RUMFL|nr:zf-HC2 domain-containing protein [Ruminococcus flavefaciens]SHM88525.1 Putative zinc-finger [Ruminococcus flavefaciens]